MMKKYLLPLLSVIVCLSLSACKSLELEPQPVVTKETETKMLQIAQVAHATSQYTTAAKIYREILDAHPNKVQPKIDLANTLYDMGNYDDAINYFKQILAKKPKNTDIIRKLGNSYMAINRPELALEKYQQALEINSSDIKTLSDLGILLNITNHALAANKCYQTALQIKSNDPSLNANYGLSLALTGQYDKALAFLLKSENGSDKNDRIKGNIEVLSVLLKNYHKQTGNNEQVTDASMHQQLVDAVIPANYPKLPVDVVNKSITHCVG